MFYLFIFLLFINVDSNNLYDNQNRLLIPMKDKLNITIIQNGDKIKSNKPPLILLHGSEKGGWIYEKYWMDYFLKFGWTSYSINMRGSFETGNLKKTVDFMDHVNDLEEIVLYFNKHFQKPVIISHSYGGLVLTKLIEKRENRKLINGSIWLSPIPPSGEMNIRIRFFFKLKILKIINKIMKGDINKDRILFYDDETSLENILKYKDRSRLDSLVPLNISSIWNNLPNKDYFKTYSSWENRKLVIGSYNDLIIDKFSIFETAILTGSGYPIFLHNSGHNMMLGSNWKEGAKEIIIFLESECLE